MKSCVIERPADTQLDLQCMPAHALLEDDYFATAPMISVRPVPTVSNVLEEELCTSFEEAISERVAVVSRQLGSLSPTTSARVDVLAPVLPARTRRYWQAWRRTLVLTCLALNLLLLGFDFMGLLVLSR